MAESRPKPTPERVHAFYSRLDRVSSAEFARGVTSEDALTQQIIDHMALLPQAKLIDPETRRGYAQKLATVAHREDAIRNVDRPVDSAGQAGEHWDDIAKIAFWHLRRMTGIGGSEIGPIIANLNGERDAFTSAAEIVQSKLALMAPRPGDIHTMRGTRAESVIQTCYRQKFNLAGADAEIDRVTGARPLRTPYRVGNPDDLTRPMGVTEGPVDIADYKCPSPDMFKEMMAHGVSIGYRGQLHHYRDIAQSQGIEIGQMYLVPFDLMAFDVARLEVPYDREFAREVLNAATTMWRDFVLKGDVPSYDLGHTPLNVDIDPDLRQNIGRKVMVSLLKKVAEAQGSKIDDALEVPLLERYKLGEGVADFGVVRLSRSRTYDSEMLRELAIAAGLDPEAYNKSSDSVIHNDTVLPVLKKVAKALKKNEPDDALKQLTTLLANGVPMQGTMDKKSLVSALVERGVDVTPAIEMKETVSGTRKKSGTDAENLQMLQDVAEEIVRSGTDILMTELAEKYPLLGQALVDPTAEEGVPAPSQTAPEGSMMASLARRPMGADTEVEEDGGPSPS